MRKITLWLISVGACLVLAVGWVILVAPDTALGKKPAKEPAPLFFVTIPQSDGVVPTDIYTKDTVVLEDGTIKTNTLVMEGIVKRDGTIDRLVGEAGVGSLTFPTDGIIGNGNGDIGDALVLLNLEDCDGDGEIHEFFDPLDPNVVELDDDGNITSVTLISAPDQNIQIFVKRSDGVLVNAFLRFTFAGTIQNARIFVGGAGAPDINWCVFPRLEDFPDMSTVRGGVEPVSCVFVDVDPETGELTREPGQTFQIRVNFHPKKEDDPCQWIFGDLFT